MADQSDYGGFNDRRLVETSRGHIHVWLAGEGRPLVLLHMSLSSGRMFRHIAPLLSEDHRLIAPDRLGFGLSDHPQEPLTMSDYAQTTVELLDAMGVEEFDVVGVHTGSTESVELATAYAERVSRVATVTLPVFTESEVTEYKERYLQHPEPSVDGSHLDWYWRWWRDGGFAGADERSREWDPLLLHEFFMDHLRSLPNFWFAYHAVFDYQIAEKIPLIEQPLLVLHPYDDLEKQTERALSILPDQAEMIPLPHLTDVLGLFTTAKEEIASYLRDFFDDG